MEAFKLYVGNVSWNVTDDSLREFFAKVGEVVDAKVIMNRETGRSKGFGFVTMADEAGFAAALELNGQELDGRPLRVNKAEPRREE